jgi:hypothetical protein
MYKVNETIKLRNSKGNEMLNFSVKRIKKTPPEPNKSVLLENRKSSVKGKKTSIIGRKWRESLSNNVLPMKTLRRYRECKCAMFKSWTNLI